MLKRGENTEVGAEISVLELAYNWDTFASLPTVSILSSFVKSLLPSPSVHMLLVHLTPSPAQDWNTWLRSSWWAHIVLSMVKEILSGSEVPRSSYLLLHRIPGNHWQSSYIQVGPQKEISTKDMELSNGKRKTGSQAQHLNPGSRFAWNQQPPWTLSITRINKLFSSFLFFFS